MSLLLDLLVQIAIDIAIVRAIARQDRKKPGEDYDGGKDWLRTGLTNGDAKNREEEIMKGREERQRMLDIIDRAFEEEE